MPYLNIRTNVAVQDEQAVLVKASASLAAMLGKPEPYVMVHLDAGKSLLFAGSDAPAAHLELKSLGLPEDQTAAYSASLCELMDEVLGVEAARVYIEFSAPQRHMWGWKSATF